MAVPMLNQCCCGCTLKTGSIIIGTLNATIAGIYFIVSIIYAVAASEAAKIPGQYSGTLSSIESVYIACAVFASVLCLVAICLVVGAERDNPKLLLPWLGYACISILVNFILSIVNASNYINLASTSSGVGVLLGGFIGICLEIYFLLVVYSLYRLLNGTVPSLP